MPETAPGLPTQPDEIERVMNFWPNLDQDVDGRLQTLPDLACMLMNVYEKHGLTAKDTDLIWRNTNFQRHPDYQVYKERFIKIKDLISEVYKEGKQPLLINGQAPIEYFPRVPAGGSKSGAECCLPPHSVTPIMEIGQDYWLINHQRDQLPILHVGQAIFYGGRLEATGRQRLNT